MPVANTSFVSFKSGTKQHILRAERQTYCVEKILPNPAWSEARYDDERNEQPLCKVCERLGPLDEEDQRRYWRFAPEDVKEVWPDC